MGFSLDVSVIDELTLPILSIIFSYWKTTLHVLARLLGQAGVKCLQVDGDASYADRSYRLRAFKENPDVQVLLMTIETGAVG